MRSTLLVSIALLSCGCGDDGQPPGAPVLSEPLEVVPFSAPLDGVRVQAANDGLDIITHGERTYLAFRTSASWFADADTEIHVVSAVGETRWEPEVTFSTGDDLREPRFLSFDGKLSVFLGRFGTEQAEPEPLGALVSTLTDGNWTEPVEVLEPGFIVSRLHVQNGEAYMTAWGRDADAWSVQFSTSDDGVSWRPVRTEGAAVVTGGATETDVLFRRDGSLLSVSANPSGDELGWGSRLCHAASIDAAWTCTGDPRRFDGAVLFTQGSNEYLVARRNVTETGAYDLGRDDLAADLQTQLYVQDYDQQPKRCALWRIGASDVPALVADFPSRGDTCAASVLRRDDDRIAVYYGSSPIDGPDVALRVGQAGASKIHRVVVHF